GYENSKVLKATITTIRSRQAGTYLKKVKGHSREEGNERADQLVGEGASSEQDTYINTYIERNLRLSGIKLQSITQSLAYQGILREERSISDLERRSTTINLDIIRYGIHERTGKIPTDRAIWASSRSKNIQHKRVRNFIWKTIHEIHKCSKSWKKINSLEHRAHCPTCDTEETMEHILTECRATRQNIVWKLVRRLLEMRNISWEDTSFGSIIGCGISSWKMEDNKKHPRADRLFMMIVSALAYFIWCLRCEWRIEHRCDVEKIASEREVHNRWLSMINEMLKTDLQSLSKKYNKKRTINPKLVKDTWIG
ncbi:hypothetical protein BDQ17DRAFT_1169044, partial [Cyathus striatus]